MSSSPRNNKVHITDFPASLTPIDSKVDGTFSFLNPTHIPFHEHSAERHHLPNGAHFLWRSRDNRKGRHAIVLSPSSATLRKTSHPREVLQNLMRMATNLNYWDISWWVAVLFTLGSVVWCINGFFSWLPLQMPSSEFATETDAAGITAFIGATIFEMGSVLLMLEAVNEKRTACFGWAVKSAIEAEDERLHGDKIVKAKCGHRHTKKGDGGEDKAERWQWYPSWNDLKTHYLRQIGFLACASQMFGATVFWISGFTALPNVIDMEDIGLTDGVFWTPQVIGGSGFIVSSWLFMLETQTNWWKPAFTTLGWHIGFWNLIGAIGFTLCGALGYDISDSGAAYQSALATFWGSWAFLIGSLFQWYEAVQKHPVETGSETASDAGSDTPS